MKILFLGDYSNMHACLASGMRRMGHECTVVSDRGGYMQTSSDRSLLRKSGMIGSMKYLYDIFSMMPEWSGYDLVQLCNPHFLALRPGKLKYIFDHLLRENGKVGLTLASDDYFFVKACVDGTFRFSEYRIGDRPSPMIENTPGRQQGWLRKDVESYNRYVYDNISSAVSLLPEYDIAARKVLGDRCHFINLPVDLSTLDWTEPDLSGKIKLFIGLSGGREIQKGTDVLLEIGRRLAEEHPDKCCLTEVRNMPLNDYLREMRSHHIVLDQLYSYSPATNALQAMALGAVAVTGAQPEYYEYIKTTARPLIEASPLKDDLYESVERLILNPEPLLQMSRDGRRIVEQCNSLDVVARKFISSVV